LKIFQILFIAAFAGLLVYASFGLPNRGDPGAVVNKEVNQFGTVVPSSYYIKNAYRQTHTPNIVTAVLGDYRSFDTLGEEVVIFAAGIICYLLLWRNKESV